MARPSRASIESVRRFNRFYTRQIGVLQERLLRTPFSLAEARILYELGTRKSVIASELQRELDLDFGYLSRMLSSLENKRLILRARSSRDGRQHLLTLGVAGRSAFKSLDTRSRNEIGKMLEALPATGQRELLEAMTTIQSVLGADDQPSSGETIKLRFHRPGDMGWVVE